MVLHATQLTGPGLAMRASSWCPSVYLHQWHMRATAACACVRASYNNVMCVGVRSYGLDPVVRCWVCRFRLGVGLISAWRVGPRPGYTEMMIWDAYLYCGSIYLKK